MALAELKLWLTDKWPTCQLLPAELKPNRTNQKPYATKLAPTWRNWWTKYEKLVRICSGEIGTITGDIWASSGRNSTETATKRTKLTRNSPLSVTTLWAGTLAWRTGRFPLCYIHQLLVRISDFLYRAKVTSSNSTGKAGLVERYSIRIEIHLISDSYKYRLAIWVKTDFTLTTHRYSVT